ncbi:MAG: hypothetical protein KC493_14685, partial [Bacteriovoracaceae bacterium]|nr:hypothetical protein [Bacteriovoracaceae bacterium]
MKFLLLIFLLSTTAQAKLDSTRYLAHPLDSTYNAINLLANDTPLPLSDAKKGVWKGQVQPSYVSIDHAFFSTEGVGGGADYKGQNLKGKGLGGSFAWSLND